MPIADPSLIPDAFEGPPGYGPPRRGFAASSAIGPPTRWQSTRIYRPGGFEEVTLNGNAPAAVLGLATSSDVAQQTVAGGDNAGPAGTDEADKPSPRVGGAVWWVVGIGGALAVVAVTTAVVTASKKRRR